MNSNYGSKRDARKEFQNSEEKIQRVVKVSATNTVPSARLIACGVK